MGAILKEKCRGCGEPVSLHIDDSCGPPDEAGTECERCGAITTWRVTWWYEVELTGIESCYTPLMNEPIARDYAEEQEVL